MTEHPLQTQVLAFAARLHFSGVVVREHAGRRLGNGHERVQTLADVGDLGQSDPRGCDAAERDELAGYEGRLAAPARAARTMTPTAVAARAATGPRRRPVSDSVPGAPEGHEHQQPGNHREHDENLLRALTAELRDEEQPDSYRSGNRAERVGRIHAADETSGILTRSCERGKRERKAGAPQDGSGQHDLCAAPEVESVLADWIRHDLGADRLERQRRHQEESGPDDRGGDEQLRPAKHASRV